MKFYHIIPLILLTCCGKTSSNNIVPTFAEGHNPGPNEKKWVMVDKLSDEFDGATLNESKWNNADPRGWRGRAPGLFVENTVSLNEGHLKITNYQLDKSVVLNEETYTHAGGHLVSRKSAEVGQYFECKMKSSKTFMSSTFWLINEMKEMEGCDRRVTELDIQESVGQITTDAQWAQQFNRQMNSNTHSRHVTCEDSVGILGSKGDLSGMAYDDFHVFGAWWKSPNEILFFLDGQLVNTVEPVADFNLPMYIRIVSETYDWNPTPPDGGMTGSTEDRTTYYDWVRVWELR
ncbi:MAG: family 16 glycosylhydrolase [Cyclobacteriaceae bacterium]